MTSCTLPAWGAKHGATLQGHDTFKLWQGLVLAAIIVGAIVYGLILWSVFRYRRKSDAIPRQFHEHTALEVIWTAIPLLIVLVVFFFTVKTENNVDALAPHPAVTIKVTAFQWGWKFAYEHDGVTVLGETLQNPEMVLPVGEAARIVLVSADVVHGFYVDAFDFSRYAQPGVTNRFDLTVRHAGVYQGQCSDFCGLYHTEMLFRVAAVPPAQFRAWLASTRHYESIHHTYIT